MALASWPCRILLGAILAVFYVLEALAVRNVANNLVKEPYLIWPREGWAFGMGAALLWLFISFFTCCALLNLPASLPPAHVLTLTGIRGSVWTLRGLPALTPNFARSL